MAGGVFGGPIQSLFFIAAMGIYAPICYAVYHAHKRITAIEKRLHGGKE